MHNPVKRSFIDFLIVGLPYIYLPNQPWWCSAALLSANARLAADLRLSYWLKVLYERVTRKNYPAAG
jgi:hypothetical protein